MTEPRRDDSDEPLVSVILPVRNGNPYLADQLQSLAAQECAFPWEMIVVDNGSTDGSDETALGFAPKFAHFQLLREPIPGKSRALNTGRTAARGKYLLVVDADDEVAEGYVTAMSAALDLFDFVGSRVDLDRFNPWGQGQYLPSDQLVPFLDFLPVFSGCATGVRATAWDEVGGFDETLMSAEDLDFSWRVQLAGGSVGVATDAVLHYRRPPTTWGNFQKARSYGRSHVWLYQRFRQHGQPYRGLRVPLAHVKRALIESLQHRDHWLWRAAWHLGLVEGRIEESIRQRTWYV